MNGILVAGVSRRRPSTRPIAVPPPGQLALLNTIIVHPLYTTRLEKRENLDVASLALSYLRNLLRIVGPVEAKFHTAFQFTPKSRGYRRISGYGGTGTDSDSPDADGFDRDPDVIRGRLANESSVWQRGQDFWTTVGWAFNCSTLYPLRWKYWKEWLEFMVDVLEADWKERERQDYEAQERMGSDGDNDDQVFEFRRASIIAAYIEQQTVSQTGFRSIIKALLADGGSLSSATFREVFDKELRGPRKDTKKRKHADHRVDIDNGQFGDYVDDDAFSSGASQPPTPEKTRATKNATFGTTFPGLADSVALRMRIFALVSEATFTLQKRSQVIKLYESFAVALKVVPLQLFALFVSQRPNALASEIYVTIYKELFRLLLPASFKDPAKIDPDGEAEGNLTSMMLEHCYMPYPANTVSIEDNTRLSLVIEGAILVLWLSDNIDYTTDFATAAEDGVLARDSKVQRKRTGKVKPDTDDILALTMLKNSAERIHVLIKLMGESS